MSAQPSIVSEEQFGREKLDIMRKRGIPSNRIPIEALNLEQRRVVAEYPYEDEIKKAEEAITIIDKQIREVDDRYQRFLSMAEYGNSGVSRWSVRRNRSKLLGILKKQRKRMEQIQATLHKILRLRKDKDYEPWRYGALCQRLTDLTAGHSLLTGLNKLLEEEDKLFKKEKEFLGR